jgi:hypothetical protein
MRRIDLTSRGPADRDRPTQGPLTLALRFKNLLAPSEEVLASHRSGCSAAQSASHGRQWISIQGHHIPWSRFGTRGRKHGVCDRLKPVLFTILDTGFREDLF